MIVARLVFVLLLSATAAESALAEGEDWTCAEAKANLDREIGNCKKNIEIACHDKKEAREIYNNKCLPHTIADRVKAIKPPAPSKKKPLIIENSNQDD